MQIFRHPLAVGNVVQAQTVADDDVDRAGHAGGFVDLAQNAAGQVRTVIGGDHVVERVAAMLLASRDLIGGIEWVKANAADADIAKTAEKAKKAA